LTGAVGAQRRVGVGGAAAECLLVIIAQASPWSCGVLHKVAGVLLAGGLSRRMGGGDKCLRPLGGRQILAHVIERARPQVKTLVLNANGDPARFAAFGLPVAADVVEGYAGPLAGVLTGLDWAAANVPDCVWLASFASDAPFLPSDLVAKLLAAVAGEGADLACAASHGRSHPVFGLWPLSLREELRRAMLEEEIRKVDLWTARYKLATVEYPDVPLNGTAIDPFFNTNRPEDLEEAERLIA
jgi:molybdopterin-guanine dinucleotide biosynthesis protein A